MRLASYGIIDGLVGDFWKCTDVYNSLFDRECQLFYPSLWASAYGVAGVQTIDGKHFENVVVRARQKHAFAFFAAQGYRL